MLYDLKLPKNHLQVILNHLAKGAYGEVAETVQILMEQARQQEAIAANPPAEAPPT